jgi:membrane dipeptidase
MIVQNMATSDGNPIIVDAHNDLLLEVAFRTFRRGEENAFSTYWLPHLKSGGVWLQVCALYADLPTLPEGALREVLGQIAAYERSLRESDADVLAVRTSSDLERVERRERIGLLLALEGAESLGYDPWMIEVFWRLGVRMVGLTWNRRNPFADGAAEDDAGGLSKLGRQLVDRCLDIGLVIDVAHASVRTFWDVLERLEGAPVVCSHAACRAVFDHPRNLGDDQLRALADAGGVLGIMQHPINVDPDRPTIGRVIDHLDHAVEVMGIEHLGLGADFTQQVVRATGWVEPPDSLLPPSMRGDAAIDDLAGPQDFPNLVAELQRRGYEGSRLEAVLGANLLRVLHRALPA